MSDGDPAQASSGFEERVRSGLAARKRAPRSTLARWFPPDGRQDPITVLTEQEASRVPELLPIRHSRMLVSPFTFFRGAAAIMAMDLAGSVNSGITVQLCGDAHLSNFGLFASPERVLVFDINDFDETLPGPWEWDVKRLAASFEVAGRQRNYSPGARREIARTAARSYREQMRFLASAPVLSAWYDRLAADAALGWLRQEQQAKRAKKKHLQRSEKLIAKARAKDSVSAFKKLVEVNDGKLRIRADPPLIVPLSGLTPENLEPHENAATLARLLRTYQSTLLQQHHPLQEFEFVDMARKVVGVGSVGTRAWVILLRGRDNDDPLLLQAKQAEASVLERFFPASQYDSHGERVVRGQRLMQSASDIFLGWQRVKGFDGQTRDFYIRQLQDWKGSVNVDAMDAASALMYAQICGQTLARAHARSGDRVAIAAYLGSSTRFDRAIARFAAAYAKQNETDYAGFCAAVKNGRLEIAAEP